MGLSLKWIWLEFGKSGYQYGAPGLRILAVVCRGRLSGFYNPLILKFKLVLLRYNFFMLKWGHCSNFSLMCFDKYPVQPPLLSRCGMFLSSQKDLHSPSRSALCSIWGSHWAALSSQSLSALPILGFQLHGITPYVSLVPVIFHPRCCVSVVSFYWW